MQSKSNRISFDRLKFKTAQFCILTVVASIYFWSLLQRSIEIEGTRYFFAMDDIHISMRYAQHLVSGNGLVWNAGEFVQGYTNLGWTVLLGLNPWLGISTAKAAIFPIVLNAVLLLMSVLWIVRFCRRRHPHSGIVVLLFAAAVGLGRAFAFSSSWGFEAVLQAFLFLVLGTPIIAASLSSQPIEVSNAQKWIAATLTSALVLVRMDSVVVVAGIVVSTSVLSVLLGSRQLRRLAYWQAVGALGTMILLLLSQRAYYGHWLPNTFYLKGSSNDFRLWQGLGQFVRHYVRDGGWSVLVAFGCACYFGRKRFINICVLFALLCCLLAYCAYTGGDYFALDFTNRFLTVGDLYFCLMACFLISEILEDFEMKSREFGADLKRKWTLFAVFISIALAIYISVDWPTKWLSPGQKNLYRSYIQTSVLLNRDERIVDGASVAIFPAGIIPHFVHRLKFIDMLGKCDERIARLRGRSGLPIGHNKYDFDYSIDQLKPDFVVTDWNDQYSAIELESVASRSQYRFLFEIFLHGSLQQNYQLLDGGYSRGAVGSLAVWQRRTGI